MGQDTPDSELMMAYVRGDEEAFLTLFNRYSPKLTLFLSVRLGKRRSHLLDELYQKTWLKIHSARKTFDPSKSFYTWFYTIALNSLRDEVGLASEKLPHTEFEEHHEAHMQNTTIEAEYILKESASRVYSLLAKLPENQRTALLLSDRDELSSKEIAEAMGFTDAAVRQLISRARKSVRASLLEEEFK